MTDPRRPIFNAIRTARGTGFDRLEVGAIDNLLDALGVPREATDAFDLALSEILRHEGGFVNHPKDPGGMTNLGVTRRTWEEWTGRKASEAEMRSLTREKVAPLYRANYWNAVKGDDLPPAIALMAFDFAVNAGPGRAIKVLQSVLSVTADGRIGPVTLGAVNAADEALLVHRYADARRAFYRALSTFPTFGRGWMRRVDEIENKAKRMVQ